MRHHRFHRRAALVAITVVVASAAVSLAADSWGTPPHSADPGTSAVRPLTERELDLLHDAEQRLTRACMTERGFRMWVVPRRPIPEDRDFPYVIDDIRWASRHGYGSDLRARREQLRAADPNRRYFTALPAPERQHAALALNGGRSADRLEVGTPNGVVGRYTDGCTARAQKQLYGDLAAWFRADVITGALPALRQGQVVADAEFGAAVRKWSGCMRERGLRHADPQHARGAFIGAGTPESAEKSTAAARRGQEVRTAVAEAECAHTSGLTATARRLDRRYDARLRDRYREEVRDRLRMEHAALSRARALLPAD